MEIGELRNRITIQENNYLRDSYGSINNNWQDYKTVWAAIYPLSGKEYFEARRVNAEVTVKIVIRFIKDIKPKMRIKYKDRNFQIESVINTKEKDIELILMCKELV